MILRGFRAIFIFGISDLVHGMRATGEDASQDEELKPWWDKHKGQFDCKAEEHNWNLAWSQMKKKYCCQESEGKRGCEVVVFDASDMEDQNMSISRQGEEVYEGDTTMYSFTPAQLMKEYIVDTSCTDPIFVRPGDGKMCSVGLFTQPRLTCSPSSGEAIDSVEKLSHLAPKVERGFSFEFEFVARPVSQQLLQDAFDQLVQQGYNRYEVRRFMQTAEGGPTAKGKLAALRHCAFEATTTWSDDSKELIAHWNWEADSSVHPLTEAEAKILGAEEDETMGTPFEVTSPGPPHVLSGHRGYRSSLLLLSSLKDMGIQAGPSQGMHVHINAMSDKAPGAQLTPTQVAYIWAAYAKYQLVIDEFLSPSRPGNGYANRLFLANCTAPVGQQKCSSNPCACIKSFFTNMHMLVTRLALQHPRISGREFCNYVLQLPGDETPCEKRYPHQRYFQLNLVPLNKFGTIEFRAHSATYDPERILRYAQFLVGFVEYFGNGRGSDEMAEYFKYPGTMEEDYAKLMQAQREATSKDLFEKLDGLVDPGTAEFFVSRAWEKGDAGCNPKGKPTTQYPSCGSPKDEDEYNEHLEGLVDQLLAGGFSLAETTSRSVGNHSMQVSVPRGATPGSYLQVMMPEGNVRAERLTHASVRNGYHQFNYNPDEADERLHIRRSMK